MSGQIDQRTIESLVFYSQFTQVINPVNLTKTRSINLAQVSSYECAEVVEDDDEKQKNKQKNNQKPKIVPIVVMQNGNELELSPDENKIFRVAWNAYTEAAANALQILQAILNVQSAQPAQPAQAAPQLPQ